MKRIWEPEQGTVWPVRGRPWTIGPALRFASVHAQVRSQRYDKAKEMERQWLNRVLERGKLQAFSDLTERITLDFFDLACD
jgi:hypothetical protein